VSIAFVARVINREHFIGNCLYQKVTAVYETLHLILLFHLDVELLRDQVLVLVGTAACHQYTLAVVELTAGQIFSYEVKGCLDVFCLELYEIERGYFGHF